MGEKNTDELQKVLGKTHLSEYDKFCNENQESMLKDEHSFSIYIKNILQKNKITQQKVFLMADIPERYGYKLLSGEKVTRQRDVILRICYAGELTLEETQRGLKKYGMPELYVKNPRDALLMILFNSKPGSIIEVNTILTSKGFEPLRTSGVQD